MIFVGAILFSYFQTVASLSAGFSRQEAERKAEEWLPPPASCRRGCGYGLQPVIFMARRRRWRRPGVSGQLVSAVLLLATSYLHNALLRAKAEGAMPRAVFAQVHRVFDAGAR